MIKYLVVLKPADTSKEYGCGIYTDEPRYRLFTKEDKAKAFIATLPDTTRAEIVLLREDAE